MTNYEKLINTLKEVFMLDKADLDFGIYRIMNQKRSDIEKFLEKDLVPQVRKVLADTTSIDKKGLQKELDDAMQQAKALGADPDTLPKVVQLKNRIAESGDLDSLENEVFSLLANFFKRYFDNGDFISMRRYKKDVYAIPYEGEEVKLHWANADQYYIKTSEYFKNYRFKISGNKTVSFELVEAETEQNNNKIQGDKERKFAIYKDEPIEIVDNELKIFFTYEAMDKKQKQEDLLTIAFDTIKSKIPNSFFEVFEKRPTEKDKDRTLLQKHLKDYVVRNTFDYFIHKDLNGFLTRELDFYIKNEVLFIDDINTRDEQAFISQLSKIKAIKKIGEKVITFLSQLEDFQKKLWLKKKFVVDTQYCITLDRVPHELYEEISKNEAQIEEWVKLFSIDEIKAQTTKDIFAKEISGFSKQLTITFLQENQFLLLDTAFFSEDFKHKLLASIENFDEQCNGLLINSDNFHALSFLRNRYNKNIDAVYIDPPYNTDASSILYKNDYKDSSFLTLIENRISLCSNLMNDNSMICVAIDDIEVSQLRQLLSKVFYDELGIAVVRSNPAGRKTKGRFSPAHEYALFYGKSQKSIPFSLEISDKRMDRFPKEDENGRFAWANLIRSGTGDRREDRPTLFFPIFVNSNNNIRIPEMKWDKVKESYTILEKPKDGEVAIYPIVKQGNQVIEKRWQRGYERISTEISEYRVRRIENGEISIDFKTRMDESSLPTTWWEMKEYASANYGAMELKELFNHKTFDFPKSRKLVEDCLRAIGIDETCKTVLDFFGGSATTAHALINLNRKDTGKRKYVLVEMGTYFNTVTKPRIQKVIYSSDWKEGKPLSREGISHCFKYIHLESYEDTLNNLILKSDEIQKLALKDNSAFKEGFILNYLLDVETKDSLLNLQWFENPFDCYLNITRNNECKPTKIDLIETFNYLIGLVVEHSYTAKGYRVISGKTLEDEKVLIVWRNAKEHSNDDLNEFLQKSRYNPLDNELTAFM